MEPSKSTMRIVILGGGFGGIYTAQHLERLCRRRSSRYHCEIVLISRENYFLMTPLLFEAGTGVLEPRHAVVPVRQMFDNVRFINASVESVDFQRRVVYVCNSADERYDLAYDHLVLALGGVTNTRIIPGSEHAFTFKMLSDAIFLRNHVIDLFERADVERDPARKRALLSFVIAGGGLVGVELMGELTEFVRNLSRLYPRVSYEDIRFELIEHGDVILPEMDQRVGQYATKVFRKRGVNICTRCSAERIEPGKVVLHDGSAINSATIILATGVVPNPLIDTFPLPKDHRGRVQTDATMHVAGQTGVWALGDCANIPDPSGKPYPPLAQHALREARVLANNIVASINNCPLKPFIYHTLGTLAALGGYRGVGLIKKVRIYGVLAWWVWRTYYLLQMPRWSRRLRVIMDWTTALFFKNDIVKLDLFGREHPGRRMERAAANLRAATAPQPL